MIDSLHQFAGALFAVSLVALAFLSLLVVVAVFSALGYLFHREFRRWRLYSHHPLAKRWRTMKRKLKAARA